MNMGAFGENFPYTNFHELNMDWIIQIVKQFNEQYPGVLEELAKKIPYPIENKNGNIGDFLISNGDGTTTWQEFATKIYEAVTDWLDIHSPEWQSEVADTVEQWLDEHPEATTTVEDGSLTEAKFTDNLKLKTLKDYITPQMFGAHADGVTDDLTAFNSAVQSMDEGDVLYIPNGNYLLSDTWTIDKSITVYCDGTIAVSHSSPVIVLDELSNANIHINTIRKSARVFDYVEGGIEYSIGMILKNCESCIVDIGNILNTTTGVILLACDGEGCHYNTLSCQNVHTFTGLEIIRQSTGGWVNGNTIMEFQWLVNTWQDNESLVASYMFKSLSYPTASETDPYKNNANTFNNLSAEYGARQANYPISLIRLDNVEGYVFTFNRVEILAQNNTLYDNFFYFTNTTWSIVNIWFIANQYRYNIGTTSHNVIYEKADYETLKKGTIRNILSQLQFNENVSITSGWFTAILIPTARTVRLQGELIINADLASNAVLIDNLPAGAAGYDVMKLQLGTTATQWQAPENVSFYKVFCGGNGYKKLNIVGGITAGTRLFVDVEYVVASSEITVS